MVKNYQICRTIRYVQEASKGGQYTLLKSTQSLVIVFGLNRKAKRFSIAKNKYFFKIEL